MKPLAAVPIALVLAALPAAANAQVTQTYTYDANGRLTGVTTTGSGGTNTAAYVYDDADNRTSRSQTGTTAYAALLRLPAETPLHPLHALVSPNGRFSLAVRSSGAFELWSDQSVVWSNPVDERARPIFSVDSRGNTKFRGAAANAVPEEGAYFALGDDGVLALFAPVESTVLWRFGPDQVAGTDQ